MRLQWERPGVVRMTATVNELAALVAGGRVAVRALDGTAGERSSELDRVLAGFDRAARALATDPLGPRTAADAGRSTSGSQPSNEAT